MDYRAINYTYIINNQVDRIQLRLFPFDDNIVEADETYNLTIVLVSVHDRVILGEKKTATITICNDDGMQQPHTQHNVYNNTMFF